MVNENWGYSADELEEAFIEVERSMVEGESARVRFMVDQRIDPEVLDAFHLTMVASEMHVTQPVNKTYSGIPTVEFAVTKGSPALAALIPLIPGVILAGLIAFGITRIGDVSKALTPLLIIIGSTGVILVGLLTRKGAGAEASQYAHLVRR